ncbi:hypothetical protein P152DRAFT_58535 [Eremomyces bilateralis CBS 781.70]|uniref:Uncharacterized protein n=1 Tax=Eremomyces bilateralis CBS 781.70 TaxID=1392243 RepID=A0A6G1G0D7_9PEZI|nr:uncharacterized protein P152DRAFT_58535 [Eremomyces bilateralis CBS 781.70]KAF1811514.1 hypothetical protein P152DRAFT_58535 [Eremomyces bilateralis CBS 781.70]
MASHGLPVAGASAVRLGFWFNHDHDGWSGATITLRSRDSVVVMAVLATVVGLTANRSWAICRFFLHRFARPMESDTTIKARLGKQEQVILRNSETAGSALLGILRLVWAQRKMSEHIHRIPWKPIVLSAVMLAHFAAFIAAGVLTSQVFSARRTVISKNTATCGQWQHIAVENDSPDLPSLLANAYEVQFTKSEEAHNYVRNCYSQGSSRGILDCGKLATRSIPFTVKHDADCPFQAGACLNGPNSAVVFDSGNISLQDLGINFRQAKELFVRRKSTCAPMSDEPFLGRVYTNQDQGYEHLGSQATVREYEFYNSSEPGDGGKYIFQPERSSYGYDLHSFYTPTSPKYAWKPPFFSHTNDSDTSLTLLRGSGVQFMHPSDDPVFAAHEVAEVSKSSGGIPPDYTAYKMDHFLNIIACHETAQFCSSITGQCSPWAGLNTKRRMQNILGELLLEGKPKEGTEAIYATSLVTFLLGHTSIPYSIAGRPAGSV